MPGFYTPKKDEHNIKKMNQGSKIPIEEKLDNEGITEVVIESHACQIIIELYPENERL